MAYIPLIFCFLWCPKWSGIFEWRSSTFSQGIIPLVRCVSEFLFWSIFRFHVKIVRGGVFFLNVANLKILCNRWWFQAIFIIVIPDPWGFMIQFDLRIFFQMGWLKPPTSYSCHFGISLFRCPKGRACNQHICRIFTSKRLTTPQWNMWVFLLCG